MLEIHEAISPGGLRHLVVDIEGRVELAEARKLEDWLLPGAPHHKGYLLPRVATGTEFSADARKFFIGLGDHCSAVAIVVTSPLVRAAVNLMLRYTGKRRDVTYMFATEAEALAWLESRRR